MKKVPSPLTPEQSSRVPELESMQHSNVWEIVTVVVTLYCVGEGHVYMSVVQRVHGAWQHVTPHPIQLELVLNLLLWP